MAWKNLLAHKVTHGYLIMKYSKYAEIIHADPVISDMPFYNPEASSGMRERSIKLFVGKFVKYLIASRYNLETGKSHDTAFTEITQAALKGDKKLSTLGSVVNDNYKFKDED